MENVIACEILGSRKCYRLRNFKEPQMLLPAKLERAINVIACRKHIENVSACEITRS